MLEWVKDAHGWTAGEYRIECVAPRLFALYPASGAPPGRPRPILATATTLTGCKYEARMAHRRRRLADLRRRHALILAVALTSIVMLVGSPAPGTLLLAVVSSLVAAHSTGVLIGTFTGFSVAHRRDFPVW